MDEDRNQIEEIKNRVDIVPLIEKYVKLRQAGKNFSGLCPFHGEKTPSFIVSPDLQRYKCFGCGESGDIFNFIQKIENLDFPEALEKLANEAGIKLKKGETNTKYKTLEDINLLATRYYYKELKSDKPALQYVHDRGFNDEMIKSFGIGYAPRISTLKKYLANSKAYSNRDLLDSGLFTQKENSIKEKFYDRIMFPIRSKRGKVIAFTGRVMPGNDWGPKYMNSPETPIFHKKDNLFGQYESRQEIRKNDLAIICEGSTDVISSHQNGIKNIVAPLGTGLTKEQLQNISALTKNILFFFDSDSAGQNALIRGFKIASELELNPYATTAAPYKDVDELLQKDPKRVVSLIKNKKEAFSFILSEYLRDKDINKLEDLDKTTTFVKSLLESVKKDSVRDHYINKVRSMIKVDIVETGIRKLPANIKIPKLQSKIPTIYDKVEKKYLQLILMAERLPQEYLVKGNRITAEDFSSLYTKILALKELNKEELYEKLKNEKETYSTFENLLFDLTDIPTDKESLLSEISQLYNKLNISYFKRKQKEISVKIAIAEENGNMKESERYMGKLMEINKMLREISND